MLAASCADELGTLDSTVKPWCLSVFPFDFSDEKGNLESLILLLYESQLFLPAESADRTVLPSWVAFMIFIPGSIRAPAVVSIYKTNSNPKFIIPYV